MVKRKPYSSYRLRKANLGCSNLIYVMVIFITKKFLNLFPDYDSKIIHFFFSLTYKLSTFGFPLPWRLPFPDPRRKFFQRCPSFLCIFQKRFQLI